MLFKIFWRSITSLLFKYYKFSFNERYENAFKRGISEYHDLIITQLPA